MGAAEDWGVGPDRIAEVFWDGYHGTPEVWHLILTEGGSSYTNTLNGAAAVLDLFQSSNYLGTLEGLLAHAENELEKSKDAVRMLDEIAELKAQVTEMGRLLLAVQSIDYEIMSDLEYRNEVADIINDAAKRGVF